MKTKQASELSKGDKVIINGQVRVVLDLRPVRCEKYSPGRVGWLVRGEDGRVYKLSCSEKEVIELVDS